MWPGSVPKVGKGRQQCRGVNIQGLWLCSKNRVADDLLWCCQHIRPRLVYTMIVHLANSGENREISIENSWIALNSRLCSSEGGKKPWVRTQKLGIDCIFFNSSLFYFQWLVVYRLSILFVSPFLHPTATSTYTLKSPSSFSLISSPSQWQRLFRACLWTSLQTGNSTS